MPNSFERVTNVSPLQIPGSPTDYAFDPDAVRSPTNIYLFTDMASYSSRQNSLQPVSPAQMDSSEMNAIASVTSNSPSPTVENINDEQTGNGELDREELETVDTVSELSFASAYSNPVGGSGSTSHYVGGSMETTV